MTTEKLTIDKFNKLNFNLKKNIYDFLSFETLTNNVISVCKSFKEAYFKLKEIEPVIKNYSKILDVITFEKTQIKNIRTKYLSSLDNLQENQEGRKDEIILYLLLKKHTNQKNFFVT